MILIKKEKDFPKVEFDGLIGLAGKQLSNNMNTYLDNLFE
jgi:hypothetical protein